MPEDPTQLQPMYSFEIEMDCRSTQNGVTSRKRSGCSLHRHSSVLVFGSATKRIRPSPQTRRTATLFRHVVPVVPLYSLTAVARNMVPTRDHASGGMRFVLHRWPVGCVASEWQSQHAGSNDSPQPVFQVPYDRHRVLPTLGNWPVGCAVDLLGCYCTFTIFRLPST